MTVIFSPRRGDQVSRALDERGDPLPVAGGEAIIYSARSPIKETENEDSAAIIEFGDGRGVVAVADGLGGHPQGDDASILAIETLIETLIEVEDPAHAMRPAILDALEQANHRIQSLGVGAGTTIAIAEIDDNTMRPYHVGDSMILLVGQRGKVRHISSPHSPVGYAVQAGMICPVEAMHHADRHLVSNLLGIEQMWIDIGSPVTMRPRDTLLIASDGLFDNLHEPEIIEIIRKNPLPDVAAQLAEIATQRMLQPRSGEPSKPDDLTFLLYRRCSPPPNPGRSAQSAGSRRTPDASDAEPSSDAN